MSRWKAARVAKNFSVFTNASAYLTEGDGNTLAVGAYGENSRAKGIDGDQANSGAPYAGAVYVFARSGMVWTQQAYVKASNTVEENYFGASVAFSADGNTLAVGSPGETTNASDISRNGAFAIEGIGAVYIFSRNGTIWSQQAFLKASNIRIGIKYFWRGNDSRSFGASVALSDNGNTLAVGVPGEDSNATGINGDQYNTSAIDEGAAYVFTRTASVWAQQAYVKASNTVSFRAAVVNFWAYDVGAKFGGSVALSGDGNTLAVGATGELSNATGIGGNQADRSAAWSGAVYVFARIGEAWTQQAYVKASNTRSGGNFGSALALSKDGNTLAVGALGEDSDARGIGGNQQSADSIAFTSSGAGAVYVFTLGSKGWTQQAYVKASNTGKQHFFGTAVALSGDGKTLAVGATGETSNATGIGGNQADNSAIGAGAVYLY